MGVYDFQYVNIRYTRNEVDPVAKPSNVVDLKRSGKAPKSSGGLGDPPKSLNERETQYWEHVRSQAAWLTTADTVVVKELVHLLAQLDTARARVKKYGAVQENPKTGMLSMSPWATREERLSKRLVVVTKEVGLTFNSRKGIV